MTHLSLLRDALDKLNTNGMHEKLPAMVFLLVLKDDAYCEEPKIVGWPRAKAEGLTRRWIEG